MNAKEQAELEHAGFMLDVEKVRSALRNVRAACDIKVMVPAGLGPGPYADLLLRIVDWAEDVLQRHGYDATWDCCDFHEYGTEDSSWPCAEVRALFEAWRP